jgi:cytochrome c-type biogenesis protein CcmH
LAIIFSLSTAMAQDGGATTVVAEEVTADEVNEIARELWCPLCSGVRLDSCELKACEQMKEVIALKLSDGEDLDSIRTYFVAQYGPQVLGEPPLEGLNWLAWLLPFVVLAIGGYVLWITIKRMTRPAPATVTANSQQHRTHEISDEYEAKLAEELKRYG